MKEKCEVQRFIEHHLIGKDLILKEGMTPEEGSFICSLLPRMIQSEPNKRPDGYAELNNKICMIEHFEFNASKEMENGGSEQKMAISHLDKIIENHGGNYCGRIETTSDKLSYLNNLVNHFEAHAQKYDSYKGEIQKICGNEKEIDGLIFLIEDKTFFGAIKTETREPFEIILTSEFAEIWNKYPNINYIVLAGTCMSTEYCIIYSKSCLKRKLNSITDTDVFVMNNTNVINHREEIIWKK